MGLFPGGIHPHEGKNGKSVNGLNAIQTLPAPARVTIPLSQHIGAPAKCLVKKGDRVLLGQKIGEAGGFVSAPVHASVSGTVASVDTITLANGSSVQAVTIDNDGQDEWAPLTPAAHPEAMAAADFVAAVREAGIVGMGGATFPTSVKFTIAPNKKAEILLINGAECEPYLTADHRLMLEKPAQIVDGIRLTMLALDIPKAVIGVESNKPDAIAALKAVLTDGITVQELPVRYPQGGEKQLIYAITKRVVPAGGLPLDVGCIVDNVGTVYAIHQAIREGRPLVDRVTTVGGLVNNPANYLVRIGTPASALIEACGGLQAGAKKLLNGGPMMGQAMAHADIPVTKGMSGLLALGDEADLPEESACIRCGRCVRACPMKLMPTAMDGAVRVGDYETAEAYGVMNCIECGACTFVCPAKRQLTQCFRMGKKVITARRKAASK